MAIVDELVTILGLKADPNAEKEGGKITAALKSVRQFALVAGTALIAASTAIGVWAKSVATATDEAGKFADSVGIAFETLQELEFATQRSGGTVSELRGDIERLTASMSSPIPGQFNQELALLGISSRNASGGLKTADEVLVDLAARFRDLSDVRAQQFGQRLGLTQSTIRLLQNGRDGITALREEARRLGGILPEDAKRVAADFNDSLVNIRFTLKGISDAAAIGVLPALTAANERLGDFLTANRELIQSGLTTFVQGVVDGFDRFFAVIDRIVGAINEFLAPLGAMSSEFDAVDAVATAVFTVLTAVAAVVTVLALKFAVVGAAIAAVVIVVDDLATALDGGDSAIGRFFDAFEDRYPALYDALSTFGEFWLNFWGGLADIAIRNITEIFEFIGGLDILSGLEGFAAKFGFGGDAPASAQTQVPIAPGVINNNNQQQRSGDITINQNISGAGNPAAVGAAAADKISSVQQTLSPGLNSPVVG